MKSRLHRSRFDSIKKLNINEIYVRDGITYHQNTDEPLTGIVELPLRANLFREKGQFWVRGNYKDGRREGLHEVFHTNGQVEERGNFIDGELDGLWEFFENGQLTVRATKTAFDSHNYSGEVAYGCASSTQKEKFTCT